jgi:hypothetical protein
MERWLNVESRRAAAEYLRQLLLKPGPYRDAWQRHVARPRDGVINQMAVGEVIAARLRAAPGRPGDAQVMPYQLRDTVSGALSGRQLTAGTCHLFADAFGFTQHEAERLRRLCEGSSRISALSGSHGVPAQAERDVDHALGRRRHQTVSLHDHIYVGEDGRIEAVRTMQVIEALAPGLDRIPFLCDTSVTTIEVGQGCKGLTGELHQICPDVFGTEILLARTLGIEETLTLDYRIVYRFPGDLTDPSEREHRRAVIRSVENLDMRVEFHPLKLPSQVWWAHWDGIEGGVLQREVVTLDSQYSAHRYLRSLDKTVVGFYWQWDSGSSPPTC